LTTDFITRDIFFTGNLIRVDVVVRCKKLVVRRQPLAIITPFY